MTPGLHIDLWRTGIRSKDRLDSAPMSKTLFLMSAACSAATGLASLLLPLFFHPLSLHPLSCLNTTQTVRGVKPPLQQGVHSSVVGDVGDEASVRDLRFKFSLSD